MISTKKLSAIALVFAAGGAVAAPLVAYDTFGTLAAANFGGSGIPNNAVAITNLDGVTLGLTATPRYSSPAVGGSNGVFQAMGGAYAPGDNLAKWSFNFYVGGSSINTYTYKLFGDYSAGAGTLESSYIDISGYLGVPDSLLTAGTIQNSENLGFNTSFAQFDPNVAGEYGFILAAYTGNGTTAPLVEVGRSAILVNVAANAVPEPGSLALLGLGLAGLAAIRKRKQA